MDQPSLPKISKPAPVFKVLLFIFGALIILAGGFWVGYFLNLQCPSAGTTNKESTFDDGWNAAKNKLDQSGLIRPEPTEIFTITGKITAITGNKISLKTDQVVTNPLADQAPTARTVTVPTGVKIIKSTTKTREELTAETAAYEKTLAELKPGAKPPSPPLPYAEEEIKLTDLKAGDTISITSDQNIKFATEIVATEIKISL
jgi:hypothetical protein